MVTEHVDFLSQGTAENNSINDESKQSKKHILYFRFTQILRLASIFISQMLKISLEHDLLFL